MGTCPVSGTASLRSVRACSRITAFLFYSGQLSALVSYLFMGLTDQKLRDGLVYVLDTLELLFEFKETTHLLVGPAAFAGCGDG